METDPAIRRLVLFMFQCPHWLYSLRELKGIRLLQKNDYASLLDLVDQGLALYSADVRGYSLSAAGRAYAEKLLLEEPKSQ
jgi:hypothetical protein